MVLNLNIQNKNQFDLKNAQKKKDQNKKKS